VQQITVMKDRLQETLRENREAHREKYLTAVERYRDLAIEEFEKNIEEVKRGGPVRRALTLPVPEDHTNDYDTAIQMLEWTIEDEIELTMHEFEQYVEDNWGWRQSFTSNTTAYTEGALA